MRMPYTCLVFGICCLHSVAWAQGKVERLSEWLKHANPSSDSYALGLEWHTPEAFEQQQSEHEWLTKKLLAIQYTDLLKVLKQLPPTGRVRVAAANSAWLEANPLRDPVLRITDRVVIPKRPSSLRVMRDDGRVCELPHKEGLWASDYVEACFDNNTSAWAWVIQPDGRVQNTGLSEWNMNDQDEPAPGSWIYVPSDRAKNSLGEAFHYRWAHWLAIQGVSTQVPLESFELGFRRLNFKPKKRNVWQGTKGQLAHRVTASNWGNVGVLQTPTARMQTEGYFGLSMHHTWPYSTLNVMLQPHEAIEIGFRYVDISNRLYGASIAGDQTYKDKSFDLKVSVLNETNWLPKLAVGMRDLGGTGLFSSEYVVASKRTGAWDWSTGLAWGYLGNSGSMANPLSQLWGSKFDTRTNQVGSGGSMSTQAWFRGRTSPFAGVQFETPWRGIVLKAEYDSNDYKNDPLSNSFEQRSRVNWGVLYPINRWIDTTVGFERGNTWSFGLRFYTNLAKANSPKIADPHVPAVQPDRAVMDRLSAETVKEIEAQTQWQVADVRREGSRVIVNAEDSYTPYSQSRLDKAMAVLHRDAPPSVEEVEIRHRAAGSTLVTQTIERDAWVKTQTEPARTFQKSSDLGTLNYPSHDGAASLMNNRLTLLPSIDLSQTLGGPDGFLLYKISASESMTWKLTNDVRVSGSLSLRLLDNYENFKYTGPSLLPRVRTYAREFLTTSRVNLPSLNIGKSQRISESWYASAYGGYLEEMYGGVGGELMYRPPTSSWALGGDWNSVQQRDFAQNFAWRNYRAQTGHLTAYWETPLKGVSTVVSTGQYLAGDKGMTFQVSKVFDNASTIGVYVTKTNVSAQQFGEGSFDKGIFWSLPFDAFLTRSSKGSAKFLWSPLTRDGGAKLIRPIELYEETQWISPNARKFQPAKPERGMSAPEDEMDPPY